MNRVFLHLDEAHDLFFQRALEDLDTEIYETQYADLEALTLVNTKPVDEGAEFYVWRRYDSAGMAKIMSTYAQGSPGVEVNGSENISRLYSVRNHYGFNIQEIRAAKKAGVGLDVMKSVAAKRAMAEELNRIALLGDDEWQLVGLYNQPNAQTYTVPADGAGGGGGSTAWEDKTVDQIIRDIFGILDQIPTVTLEIEKPKRLLLPHSRLRLIANRRIGPGDGALTILKYVQGERPEVEIRGALLLDTAGDGGGTRMVAYDPDRAVIEWLVAIPFEQFPPQWSGLKYVIECHARAGGVVLRRPLTMAYGDDI